VIAVMKFGFHKMRIISWLTETLLAVGEGICSTELVSWLLGSLAPWFVFWLHCGGLRRVDVTQGSSQWRGFCSSDADLALYQKVIHLTR
jgi:hypothetical protein